MARMPEGDAAPRDGALPAEALAQLGGRPFGIYLHVPFCSTRCGYCDFNTYVPGEDGAAQSGFMEAAIAELDLAARVLGDGTPTVDTVFVGGGTPSILPAEDLAALLGAVRGRFGLSDGVEVTTEANPESVDPAKFAALRDAGFTRVSLGMQSAVPSVLKTLDRVHTPGRPEEAVREARAAGFDQVSLDLIYGTPGETADDWRTSLEAALSAEPDHISTYSLIVEPGTRMAAQVARGELIVPGEDAIVDRFETAERVLADAGMDWYETCSWATGPDAYCRHNLGYWSGGNWWGIGPGAHSHVGGVRWWNVLHPRAWGGKSKNGISPAAARETADEESKRLEAVMLGLRLREGVALDVLTEEGRAAAAQNLAAGMLEPADHAGGRAVLTLKGRLMADPVTVDLSA
ncbi:MAG: radical SAM family heme chaperone HemW [Solirubrobacterales bacterium]